MNPFLIETNQPFVAIQGKRNGYLQLATSAYSTEYSKLPDELFLIAKAWCQILEQHGAKRVYWITLSEVVDHLHIHLYPRWEADTLKGLELFNQRESEPQPAWEPTLLDELNPFSKKHNIELKQF